MLSALRFLGLLIIHTLMAIIGSAIAEIAIWKLVPAHSVTGILWKELALSVLCGTSLGFFMARMLRTSSARLVWALMTPWFFFGLLIRHGDVFGSLVPFHRGAFLPHHCCNGDDSTASVHNSIDCSWRNFHVALKIRLCRSKRVIACDYNSCSSRNCTITAQNLRISGVHLFRDRSIEIPLIAQSSTYPIP